jgi:hypothetical protein
MLYIYIYCTKFFLAIGVIDRGKISHLLPELEDHGASGNSEDKLEDDKVVGTALAPFSKDVASHQTVIRLPPAGSYPLDILTSRSEYDLSSDASTSNEPSDDEYQPENLPHLLHQHQPP